MGEKKRRFDVRKRKVAEAEATDRYSSCLEILDAWELLSVAPPTQNLSLREWEKIGEAMQVANGFVPEPRVGTVTFGLNEGAGLVDGRQPLNRLITHALMTDSVWLPNPIFTFLSPAALHASIPFGNPAPFKLNGLHIEVGGTQSIWSHSVDERLDLLRSRLPGILSRLRELRPLIECGAVRLTPWEVAATLFRQEIIDSTAEFTVNPKLRAITERHPQEEYTLGVYFGGMGFTAADGTHRWIEEKSPVVTYGLLNAAYASVTGASFAPQSIADRDVFDFIMTDQVDPTRRDLVTQIDLPNFSKAVLPDFVNVRRDSEALHYLKTIVRDAAHMSGPEEDGVLEDRLREVAERVRMDSNLWRLSRAQVVQISLGVVGAVAYGGSTSGVLGSAIVGAIPSLVALAQVVADGKRRAGRGRAELLIRIADRMSK